MNIYKTHDCGELRSIDLGKEVKIAGWLHSKRDHGGLLFLDIRDFSGLVQAVVDEQSPVSIEEASHIKLESVLLIEGKVAQRAPETINPKLDTGEIEIRITKLTIESAAQQIPFQVNESKDNFPEDLRLKYRYLDLRHAEVKNNILLRSQVISYLRHAMEERGFIDIQTPILTASSPEGARDFLVPSRKFPGKFYALPQAPQQFKQLLMVAGFPKYYQIAPCFRDEDGRADRVLEFYQLDMEMSFVTQEDIFAVMEPIIQGVFKQFSKRKVTDLPFPRIDYRTAMLKYGTDKPDLRNPIEITEVAEVFAGSEFSIFAKNVANGMVVRAIPAPQCGDKPRSFFDKMIEFAIAEGAKGLGYINFDAQGEAKGPIAKFLTPERLAKLQSLTGVGKGDAVFFSSAKAEDAAKIAGKVRSKLGQDLQLIKRDEYRFCWIVDFPFFEINEETGKLDFCHNPFSMPQGGMEALNQTKDPLDLLAYQYDIVCNGYEMASGGIRNHQPEIMYKVFSMVGYDQAEVNRRFSGMINAFQYGAPPHGGCAPGVDRIVMLLLDEPNLREVIPFPANGKGMDLMMGAPSYIDLKQLRELHIQLDKKAEAEQRAELQAQTAAVAPLSTQSDNL